MCHGIIDALADNKNKKLLCLGNVGKSESNVYLYHAQKFQIIKIKLVSSVILVEILFFMCLVLIVPKNISIM